ncbi:IS66 family transposase [Myxococcota bacterium]
MHKRRAARKKRRKNAKAKKELPTETVHHEVPDDELHCPKCGGVRFGDLGEGEVSYEYEYIPGRFVRRKHIRRKKACRCGCWVVTAPAPVRVSEGVQYGPGFHAHVVVAKCADSLPLNRQAKQLRRLGVPIGRSTLCDLFHRCGDLLKPLRDRMIVRLRDERHVNADETPQPVLAPEKTRRGYLWVFVGGGLMAYVFSPTRSGRTPQLVLGESQGILQVDGYTGYNTVTTPSGRVRVGCWAHARRYFWKALPTKPQDAGWFIDRIGELYQVEYQAAYKEILGSAEHLALRQACSAPVVDDMKLWLEQERESYPPKSPMGAALTYLDNSWDSLQHFLADPKVRLDNNISEQTLRIVALGRHNFLFVGNDDAGDRLAVLQSLVSSCELNGVNPEAYLADVLIRIQYHPACDIDDLLPDQWQPADTS